MVTATHMGHVGFAERMHVRRTRGAMSGTLLVLLGIWGGIIPFLGPTFGYAYTPDAAWHYTIERLYLAVLPGAAAIIGGLLLIGSANRLVTSLGGWLAAAAGAWFIVGQPLSPLWNGGTVAGGTPADAGTNLGVAEEIGFFYGLGAVILFLAAMALGRMSVIGVRDLDSALAQRSRATDPTATDPTATDPAATDPTATDPAPPTPVEGPTGERPLGDTEPPTSGR